MQAANLLNDLPAELPVEAFHTIHRAGLLRIERIVSQGHSSPPGFWYDQEDHEWVMLLKGSASVQFEGEPEPVELVPGAYLNIPAHARHRVASTHPTEPTVWLAVHYRE